MIPDAEWDSNLYLSVAGPGIILLSCATVYYYGALLLPQYVIDTFQGYRFLFHGREMIAQASKQYGEQPFSLPTPSERVHVVSSKQHFAELAKAHTSQLSLHAAVLKIFSPKHALGGFQFPNRRDIEGMNVVRAIRSANVRLVHYIPAHFRLVEEEIQHLMSGKETDNNGYIEVPLLALVRNMMIRANTLFIISEETANGREFLNMTAKYANRALLTAEICRLVPTWSKRTAEKYLAEGATDPDAILLKDRNYSWIISQLIFSPPPPNEQASALEFLTRCYPPEWSIDRMVREVAMAWMPGMSLLTTVATNLLQDIFTHSEHIPALREEIAAHSKNTSREDVHVHVDVEKMPFLESFIMESARVHSYESTLDTFTFSDGYVVPKGDWVEFNQQAAFNNPTVFPNPGLFDPYRHMRSSGGGSGGGGRRFKDVSVEWPMWGAPKLAW
ncbi:cytochrome P450 [Periconia macrospinosa]|uniref:Cytochrome P450 n=1 Tax=Periconia macrospinosa TaxID=97972 RepID=A0A2V1DQQ1_9PLEO|nr:cytochrome P450 [Periconia macrospinosa]